MFPFLTGFIFWNFFKRMLEVTLQEAFTKIIKVRDKRKKIDLWAHLSWEMPAACWPWKWVTLCCRAIPGGLQEGSGKSGLPEALGPPDLPLSSSPQSDVAFLFLYRMWVRFSHSLLSLSAFMCWFSVSQLSPPFLLSPTHSSSPVFEPSILPVCEDRAGPFSSFYHLQALATWRGHSQRH